MTEIPQPSKKHAGTRGDEYECRLARLCFAEGAFVRRKVDLGLHFGDRFQVTDIDVLCLRFSETLALHKTIGECKTSEARSAPSASDRLLWNAGLRALLDAEGMFLATLKPPSDGVRQLASELGADVLDPADVERRERLQGLNGASDYGSHHPDLVPLQRVVREAAKKDDRLTRVYVFVRSEFWFLPAAAGLKRALGGAQVVARTWSPRLPGTERYAAEWLIREAVICAAVALVELAGERYRTSPKAFGATLNERLAEGLASYAALSSLAEMVDRYVIKVLTDARVEPAKRLDALGAFAPSVPRYAEPLLEVVERFAAAPRAARDVPRLLDWRSGCLARAEDSAPGERFFPCPDETRHLARVLQRFLVGQIGLPEEPLSFLGRERNEPASDVDASSAATPTDDGETSPGGPRGSAEADEHPASASQLELD